MRALLVFAAFLVASCVATLGPRPAPVAVPGAEVIPAVLPVAPELPNPQALLDALAAIPRPNMAMALAAVTPQPAQVLSDGQLSVEVVGIYGAQKTHGGRWIVYVPADGSAKVTAVASSRGAASWGMNEPGPNNSPLVGRSTPLPLTVRPCDALWIVSGSDGGTDRPFYAFASTSQPIDEAMGVVFVPYEVREEMVGKLLCPPVWGRRGVLVDFLRSFPFPIAWIDWSRLPAVIDLDELYRIPGQPRPGDDQRIDPTQWGAARPVFAQVLAQHRYFAADLYSEWAPHIHGVPYTAHQGYGTFVLGQMGQAMLLALSTAPLADRQLLALAIAQRGIDDLGGLCDGSWRYPLGGHCWGRRGPIVMLGHLFGIDVFADPTPVVGDRLPEDQLVTVTSWWGEENWTGYLFSRDMDPALWTRHPSTWGNSDVHGTDGWCERYGGQVVPAMVAQATAIVLMGREKSAPKMVNMVRCWMRGPASAQAAADLVSLRIDLAFGKDYAVQQGFAVAAWRRYVH